MGSKRRQSVIWAVVFLLVLTTLPVSVSDVVWGEIKAEVDSGQFHLRRYRGGNASIRVTYVPRYVAWFPVWVSVEKTDLPDWLMVAPARLRFPLSPRETDTLQVAFSKSGEIESGTTGKVTLTLTGRLAVGSQMLRSLFEILPATIHFQAIYSPRIPPTVNITSPRWGAEVHDTVTIQGTAAQGKDAAAIERVEVRIENGSWDTAVGTARWSYQWDSTNLSNGNYIAMARAYNGSGYSSLDAIVVRVRNTREKDMHGYGVALVAVAIVIVLLVWKRESRH